jgi:hypothetical protein
MRVMAATLLALAVSAAVTLAACDSDRRVLITESNVRDRTTPIDALSVSSRASSHASYSTETTWEFTTGQSWSDYLAWVQPRLLGFTRKTDSETSAMFVRVDEGDSFTLVLEAVELEPRLRVRITWRTSST